MTERPMEMAALIQLYGYLVAVADPVRKLSSVYTRIQSGMAAADRIYSFLDRQPRVRANSGCPRLVRHDSAIEFRDVCFSYEPGRPILTNVHLQIRFGETVALVGGAGSQLSGGEKQRPALARAIVRDPSIFILDEFTSQIDAESEALIHRALKEFTRNRTTLLITHRVNTLEMADRIVVVDNG